MDSKLTHRGYRIPYSIVEYKQIKKDLTLKANVPNGGYEYGNKPFPIYRNNLKFLYVPKFYGIKKYGKELINEERKGESIDLECKLKARPYQEPVISEIIIKINKEDATILSVPCAYGKTICSLLIAHKLRAKTLILVHKEFLLNQWIERINQCFHNPRIGTIQRNTIDVEDKDFVIAMLQSVTTRKDSYPSSVFDSFAFTIVDECHHICAKSFSKALFQISTKKMLGLSATPTRKDGLCVVLEHFFGSITTFTVESSLVPEIRIVKAEYSKKHVPVINAIGKINLARLITDISLDEVRNSQIVELIKELNSYGRKILVLTERRTQCETLCDMLPFTVSKGLYMGGMKQCELDISNTKDVIFATYSMAHEGYDNKVLDTLIFATGRTDIEQSVGRIVRQKNAFVPLIVDINDTAAGCLKSQATRRKNFYKSRGWIKEKPKEVVCHFI